jgi:hypothetical protein
VGTPSRERHARTGAVTTVIDEYDHVACVKSWMKRAEGDGSPQQLIVAFEEGFGVLWRRAHQTLGTVTLMAIADRVLYTAAEHYKMLSVLKIDSTGILCCDLKAESGQLDQRQLTEGIRFMLVEFLTVLSSLTADILTPSLHAELSSSAARPGQGEKASTGTPPSGGRE